MVDAVRDFEKAIDTLDCSIITRTEVAESYRTVAVFGSAEWDHARQKEENHRIRLPPGER